PTVIFPLSLHDALPIFLLELRVVLLRALLLELRVVLLRALFPGLRVLLLRALPVSLPLRLRPILLVGGAASGGPVLLRLFPGLLDRKSTRLNSSHVKIS